jgi:hypothetical protein
LVVAQKLFAIPWKEVAIVVKKMNKKAAYRNTVSRFFYLFVALKGQHLNNPG